MAAAAKLTVLDDVLSVARKYQEDNLPRVKLRAVVLQLDPGPDIVLRPSERTAEGGCSFDRDTRTLVWFGRAWVFPAKRAAVVGLLFAAWQAGNPAVSASGALSEAESDCKRIVDLFGDDPAWKAGVIARAGAGLISLYEPESDSEGG